MQAAPGGPIDVVPGVLTLRFTTNSGGAFSIGQRAPWFFVGVTAVSTNGNASFGARRVFAIEASDIAPVARPSFTAAP